MSMISVSEAIALVLAYSPKLPPQTKTLLDSLGCVTADNIFAQTDIPPFDQSAMDGYAFRFEDWNSQHPLKIAGEIPAGQIASNILPPNFAMRIFTGAAVPPGADTVVMQEKAELQNNGQKALIIRDLELKKGANIRPSGSQIRQGDLALPQGSLITAGAIGYLAMLGISNLSVYPRPRITLMITGNELTSPGEVLPPGKVFECNSFSLTAALRSIHIQPVAVCFAPDDKQQISSQVQTTAPNSDLIILTGGVSVGNYDFVPEALTSCGTKTLFHKVKQKPGKPMYAGVLNNTLIFGLPGNPAAVLTGFYRYILPAIKSMMNLPLPQSTSIYHLADNYPKKTGLSFLLKGKIISRDEVMPLPNQLSYLMDSFAEADCLIELEENKADYQKGDEVTVFPFV
ncbi:MAG: molybdopterin molybdotransferase MoeA [Sphingobacteriales bacterium]|nr:MAG: molybdopterin molybdotransferase MoeA [Sphingobacteriales bacterium]